MTMSMDFKITLRATFFCLCLVATDRLVSMAPENGSLFCSLLPEMLQEIIASAYVRYDDPIEFTYLAQVSHQWRAIIQAATFIKYCEAKGFKEPVLVFRQLGSYSEYTTDHYRKEGITVRGDTTVPEYKNKVFLDYFDPNEMAICPYDEGIFADKTRHDTYVGMYVNPAKAVVINTNILGDILLTLEERTARYNQSKMSLDEAIKKHENGAQERLNHPADANYILVHNRCTGEPEIINYGTIVEYYDGQVMLDGPIPPARLVQKVNNRKFSEYTDDVRTGDIHDVHKVKTIHWWPLFGNGTWTNEAFAATKSFSI